MNPDSVALCSMIRSFEFMLCNSGAGSKPTESRYTLTTANHDTPLSIRNILAKKDQAILILTNASLHISVLCLCFVSDKLEVLYRATPGASKPLLFQGHNWGPPLGRMSALLLESGRFVISDGIRTFGISKDGAVLEYDIQFIEEVISSTMVQSVPNRFALVSLIKLKCDIIIRAFEYDENCPTCLNSIQHRYSRMLMWEPQEPWIPIYRNKQLRIVGRDLEARCPVVVEPATHSIYRCPDDLRLLQFVDGHPNLFALRTRMSSKPSIRILAASPNGTRALEWELKLDDQLTQQLNWPINSWPLKQPPTRLDLASYPCERVVHYEQRVFTIDTDQCVCLGESSTNSNLQPYSSNIHSRYDEPLALGDREIKALYLQDDTTELLRRLYWIVTERGVEAACYDWFQQTPEMTVHELAGPSSVEQVEPISTLTLASGERASSETDPILIH